MSMAIVRTVFSPRCCENRGESDGSAIEDFFIWEEAIVLYPFSCTRTRFLTHLRDLQHQPDVVALNLERAHDGGKLSIELDVNNGADHLGNAAIGGGSGGSGREAARLHRDTRRLNQRRSLGGGVNRTTSSSGAGNLRAANEELTGDAPGGARKPPHDAVCLPL